MTLLGSHCGAALYVGALFRWRCLKRLHIFICIHEECGNCWHHQLYCKCMHLREAIKICYLQLRI